MFPMLSGPFIKGDNGWVVLAHKTISVPLTARRYQKYMHLPNNDNFDFFFLSTKHMLFGLSAIFARNGARQNGDSLYFCTKGSNHVF